MATTNGVRVEVSVLLHCCYTVVTLLAHCFYIAMATTYNMRVKVRDLLIDARV
jgi:hypothetical protein